MSTKSRPRRSCYCFRKDVGLLGTASHKAGHQVTFDKVGGFDVSRGRSGIRMKFERRNGVDEVHWDILPFRSEGGPWQNI